MLVPTLDDIRATRRQIDQYVLKTPVWHWQSREITQIVGGETSVILKLELFQHTGTFKPRGALSNMLRLDSGSLRRGVTAVSAGNHAIAVGYAAQALGTTAKVVMPKNANLARVNLCRAYDAEVELVEDVHAAFERVEEIVSAEGRSFIHPYEGLPTILGTATVGLELCGQADDLDAVIVPIGGGGLCAGIAVAVKLLQRSCQVIGVEPEGAALISRSLASGKPESLQVVDTIADSLGPPYATPNTFAICQQYLDDVVLISDDEMRRAMLLLFQGTKLAVEPAGAAATAALCGPLRQRLEGKRVGLIVCGTNIDVPTFAKTVAKDLA